MLVTLYLRLLVVMLENMLLSGSILVFIDQCDVSRIYKLDHITRAISERASFAPIRRWFEFFAQLLSSADNSAVAFQLLEVLSILAHDNLQLTKELTKLSWISLHTIYVIPESDSTDGCGIPFSLNMNRRRLNAGMAEISMEKESLQRVLFRAINRICKCDDKKTQGLKYLKRGMLRQWGLTLTEANTGRICQLQALSSMIVKLGCFLESLDKSVRGKSNEDATSFKKSVMCKNKPSKPSSIVGLDASSFPMYFEIMTAIVLTTTATLHPVAHSDSGPYRLLQEGFAHFRRLIELYKHHHVLFPRKSVQCIVVVSKEVLLVATCQLHRCIEWRNIQPQLSLREREAGKEDHGSVAYLQTFLDEVSSHTTGAILSLCNFWQNLNGVGGSPSRASNGNLRFAAEKAAGRMKDIALAHSFPVPTFSAICVKLDDRDLVLQTEGFHKHGNSALIPPMAVQDDPHCTRVVGTVVPTEDGELVFAQVDYPVTILESSKGEAIRAIRNIEFKPHQTPITESDLKKNDDDSFEAAGDWGDDSDGSTDLTLNATVHANPIEFDQDGVNTQR